MRVGIIVLVLFVVLFVAITIAGANRHSSEGTPRSNNRPALPSALSVNWSLIPSFLKVQRHEITVFGTAAGPSAVAIAPGQTAYLRVRASTKAYRMMQLQLGASFPVAPTYPSITSAAPSQTPESLSQSQPQQTLVLPQAGGLISLTCLGPGSCAVSY